MLDPKKRPPVQQQVAQRAAAKGRQKSDYAHPDGIEALARRFQQARHGKGGRAAQFDQQPQRFSPGLNLKHGPIVMAGSGWRPAGNVTRQIAPISNLSRGAGQKDIAPWIFR